MDKHKSNQTLFIEHCLYTKGYTKCFTNQRNTRKVYPPFQANRVINIKKRNTNIGQQT